MHISFNKMAFTRRSLILCSAFILIPCGTSMNWNLSYEDQSLAHATLLIIRKHLSALTPTIKIVKYSDDPEVAYKNTATVDYLLQNLPENISVEIDVKDLTNNGYYILIVDSYNAFHNLFKDRITLDGTNGVKVRSSYFIILITTAVSGKIMQKMFLHCSWRNIFDVNIITFSPEHGVISMFTFNWFSEKACKWVQPYLHFTFDQDFENLKTIFPQKLHNLYKCPLRVMARLIPPFVTFTGNFSDPQPVGDWENLAGFEGSLLKHLSHALNFTIVMQPFVDYFECFSELYVNSGDVSIGGLSNGDPLSELVSTSIVYYHTELMHVVRGKEMDSLGILVMPFSAQLWLLNAVILTALIYLILQLRAMNKQIRRSVFGEDNNMTFITLFGILVGYGVKSEPKRPFARVCFIMVVLLTFILRTGYQGAQFKAIGKDKIFAPIPTGFNQLVKENYSFLLSKDLDLEPNAYYTSLLSKDKVSFLDLYEQNSVIFGHRLDFDRLSVLEKTYGNNASVVLRDSFINYMVETYRRKTESQLFMINEVAFKYQLVMAFQKNSILLPAFDNKLQSLSNSGIITKLIKEINRESDKRKETMRSVNKKLTVESLEGVFKIYFFLTSASIAVFGLEMLSKRSNILEKFLEFIH